MCKCYYNDIKINEFWFTQQKLKRIEQIPQLMLYSEFLTPVKLQWCELDDQVEIIDGHHRIVALYLKGEEFLNKYDLVYSDKPKRRFWKVKDVHSIWKL